MCDISKRTRLVIFAIEDGIPPVNEFWSNHKLVNLDKVARNGGTLPLSLLPLNDKVTRSVIVVIKNGMVPVIGFVSNHNWVNLVNVANEAGMLPYKLFVSNFNATN